MLRRQSQGARLGLELLAGAVVGVLSGALILVGALGILVGFVTPFVSMAQGARQLPEHYRRMMVAWTGIAIDTPYRPAPQPLVPNDEGRYRLGRRLFTSYEMAAQIQQAGHLLRDPATWRDLLWLVVVQPLATAVLIGAPMAVGLSGLLAVTGPLLSSWPWWTPAVGVPLVAAYLSITWWALRVHGRVGALLLRPTSKARLTRRVQELAATRAHATDAGAAELSRIERDLHDGAQARIVAVGITLRTAERLFESDPATAKELVAEARTTAASALRELRALVRGIHPPVLAERGLADAVRALALDAPLESTVHAELDGEPEPPLAAAVYFAVAEVVTNSVKHARAQHLRIELAHRDRVLRAAVSDDGVGGASPVAGSGLDGVRRRLATFDGKLVIDSPAGGPTVVTMEVPCALSWRKTSISFGPA